MKTKIAAIVGAVGLCLASIAPPAFATEAVSQEVLTEEYSSDTTEEITFTVIGDIDADLGDTVDPAALESVGVDIADVPPVPEEPNLDITPLDSPKGTMATTAAATANVGWTWKDYRNRVVNLRTDVNHKIYYKHNVNWKVARTTTKYPQSVKNPSGTRWEYRTPVNKVTCTGAGFFSNCRVTATVTVLAVVDFRILSHDKKSKGVVTTYCPGSTLCPSWVKNAVNT